MESSATAAAPLAWRGATLLEVLTALSIVSFGLAGLTATQLQSLAQLRALNLESQARLLVLDMGERLHGSEPGDSFADELALWQAGIATALPEGQGVVCIDSTPNDGSADAAECDGGGDLLAIKLWWDEDRDGTAERRQVSILQR